MNKLEQILAEFTKNFVCTDSDEEGSWEYIPDEADIPAQIRRFLADKLVEYARSKVTEKVENFSNEDSYADIYTGHNECIDMFISSIDQDLLSLKEK